MGMIFIVSSTGILIYKTHCVCTDTALVSIYVLPETCESDIHLHHIHFMSGEEKETDKSCCHDCSPQTHDCGCNMPEVSFLKLFNQFSKDEIEFVNAQFVKIIKPHLTVLINLKEPTFIKVTVNSYIDPPPKFTSSINFLIQVNQLKIPLSSVV